MIKLKLKLKFNCLISECNRQSEVIRLLEEYQNSSSTGSEETYYDDYETEDPNCTCDSGHTHEHQVSTMGSELLWSCIKNFPFFCQLTMWNIYLKYGTVNFRFKHVQFKEVFRFKEEFHCSQNFST